jgi:hypothetical protein
LSDCIELPVRTGLFFAIYNDSARTQQHWMQNSFNFIKSPYAKRPEGFSTRACQATPTFGTLRNISYYVGSSPYLDVKRKAGLPLGQADEKLLPDGRKPYGLHIIKKGNTKYLLFWTQS